MQKLLIIMWPTYNLFYNIIFLGAYNTEHNVSLATLSPNRFGVEANEFFVITSHYFIAEKAEIIKEIWETMILWYYLHHATLIILL